MYVVMKSMGGNAPILAAAWTRELSLLSEAFHRENGTQPPERLSPFREDGTLVQLLARLDQNGPSVGMATMSLRYAAAGQSPWHIATIDTPLFVLPEYRRQGYGRALIEAALEVANSRGMAFVDVSTEPHQRETSLLYEALNFSLIPMSGWVSGSSTSFYRFFL